MTPREKAEELIEKFKTYADPYHHGRFYNAMYPDPSCRDPSNPSESLNGSFEPSENARKHPLFTVPRFFLKNINPVDTLDRRN